MRKVVAADALCAVPGTAVAAAFAFRGGVPGFRHDWLWPAERATFIRWLFESGFSLWNPHGLGSAGQVPSLNPVLLLWAGLAALGAHASAILFIFLVLVYAGAAFGVVAAFEAFDVALDPVTARILGATYGLNPICFQKSVAGHLWWLAAAATLPWFCAAVRIGCVRTGAARRAFAAAALLMIVASAQIQFLLFEAVALVCIAAPFARRAHVWAGATLVVGAAALHNAMWFVIPFVPTLGFDVVRSHATVSWEKDMSGFPVALWLLTGYEHYDGAALAGVGAGLYTAGRYAVAGLAAAAVLVRTSRALSFAVMAAFALLLALGLNGPLAPWLREAIFQDRSFIIFREFFHVMAVYAFAAIMLAGIALAALPNRALRVTAAIVCACCALPFLSGGLLRLVPAVTPDPAEAETTYSLPHLRALGPLPEPIGVPDRPEAGLDPARFADDVVTTENTPLFVYAFLMRPAAAGDPLLADLGIDALDMRADRVSRLDRAFEPHAGASRELFRSREASFARRLHDGGSLADARALVQLETSDAGTAGAALSDRDVPPGDDVELMSSRSGNDIDREWVAAHLWFLIDPAVGTVAGDPLLTRSGAPLQLEAPASAGTSLWILAMGGPFELDGTPPLAQVTAPGAYRWLRWILAAGPTHELRAQAGALSAVARVIRSADAAWHPRNAAPATPGTTVVAAPSFAAPEPWHVAGRLPPHPAGLLVFARSYASGWHLRLDGRDRGGPHRVDGIFNGWTVPASSSAQDATLDYEPQRAVNLFLLACALAESGLLALALAPRLPRLPHRS